MELALLYRGTLLGRLCEFAIGLELLLHHLLHTNRIHNQFKILQDFELMPGDAALRAPLPSSLVREPLAAIRLSRPGPYERVKNMDNPEVQLYG